MKQNTVAAQAAAEKISARERRRLIELRHAREEEYRASLKKLSPLLLCVLLLSALMLALCFCDLAYIYNLDVGREVGVSVWSFALATISGSFSSPQEVFGDIAVPFYYYAETGTILTGILALLTILSGLALTALAAVLLLKKKYDFLPLLLFAAAVTAVMLLGGIVAALTLNGSQILPIYCSGNPACSIRTDGWLPFLAALAALIVAIVTAVKYHAAQALLQTARPVRTGGAA